MWQSIQELIGSLIIRHTHSMLSQSLYTKIRGVLTLCNVNLPTWATIQASRARIRVLLRTRIEANLSVFDNPCYTLSARALIAQVGLDYSVNHVL